MPWHSLSRELEVLKTMHGAGHEQPELAEGNQPMAWVGVGEL